MKRRCDAMLKIHRETFIIIVSKILSIFHKEPFRPKELLKHIDYNMTTMYRVLCVLRSYPTVCTYDDHTKKYQLQRSREKANRFSGW